jgi:hypothetical protein
MASSRQKMNFRNVEKPDRGTPLLGLEGKKTLLPPVEGGVFLLTSSFIERANRKLTQHRRFCFVARDAATGLHWKR